MSSTPASASAHPPATPALPGTPPALPAGGTKPDRLLSLDAYRGLIMLTLAANGFGLAATARNHLKAAPDSAFWQAVFHQFEHVEWAGGGYWDLIQPSFMFMVGVSMAYSYLRRQAEGQSYRRMFGHAVWRAVVLFGLGIFLISNGAKTTQWSLMNVLTQIGLGYPLLFLCWGRGVRVQALAAGGVLVATWLLYAAWPGTGIPPGGAGPGVPADWAATHLAGIGAAWHKNANAGHFIDLWLLNQLPQAAPFEFNRGGYQSINFLPSLATMIFGLMAGEWLRGTSAAGRKLRGLLLAGAAGIVAGQLLHSLGLCPWVKRLWTPAWALYSTGWCCLLLGAFYGVVDVAGWRRWSWPLGVIGMNSIAVYCFGMTLKPWAARTLQTHLGPDVFLVLGEAWSPTVQATLVGLMFWVACWWMYRQRIFVRI